MAGDGCTLAYTKSRKGLGSLGHVAAYTMTMLALAWFLAEGSQKLGYNWQWYQIPKYLFTLQDGFRPGLLLQGLWVTFKITGASLLLAFAVGLLTALSRMSKSKAARLVARIYMELVRNSPLLIQLFFIYFVIAPLVDISSFWAAVWALSLFEGAYVSEILRAGITSLDKGQFEAAKSLGMSPWPMYRHIILPQAIRRVLPPLTSQAISLVKDSALVSTIAIFDLTMQGQAIVAETFLTFEIWFTVAAIYLAVTLTLSQAVNFLKKHLQTDTPN
ncbi:amino acid ABC transporter permease [Pseudodesulfovibrio senegalensis]|jgi:polar amino acid transport system permease protein|uniref:Putative glutamine transport system permease protein GlnP n=1 Tax=Pseudodesulfovibrio senegalensis TaxID=1721087 RepID=A0A6N6MZP1_9BACT|nr:amino acid ABC transporter permease [Pseudodesulfovibrio senegalensis]KAB1441151.1 amino acid ABC transporter permease [Pseudodesulfovibrio senegalensis]